MIKQKAFIAGISFLFVSLVVLIYFPGVCFAAAGGARPISLGGAYVAISDDVHAASWNPAGLAWQQNQEFSYSGIFSQRTEYISGDFISDDYAAYAQPFSVNYRGDYDERGGWGIYFHNSGYEDDTTRAKQTLWQPGIAYGKTFGFDETMAWGANINVYMFDSQTPGSTSTDEAIGLNVGYLWYAGDDLTVGLLIENVNEPTVTLHNVNSRIIRIWRPGIAYYFDEQTILSLEIYDLTGNTKDKGADYSQNIRLGFEHYISEEVSIRLGAHHPNSEAKLSRYYSFGLGWLRSDFMNAQQMNYYIDYTFIFWPDAAEDTEDYTHQLGFTVKF